MAEITSREIVLKQRPQGLPQPEDFELVERRLPAPQAGQVLVRNIYLSVDPYMRGRMSERRNYVAAYQVNETMNGGCIGQVVQSNNPAFRTGEYVLSGYGWREYFLSDGKGLAPVDPRLAPIQAYLGVAGMTGFTAYYGLLEIGQPKPGETVFVSAAAGAVGSVAAQIAKLKGCRVVGSAGSDEKVAWLLKEAGLDAAFNYKRVDQLSAELGQHCPSGLDVYFDNVGADHLEAALGVMNDFGRIVACGMISQYNATRPPSAPRNLTNVVSRRLKIQGFIISDHSDRRPQFYVDMGAWLAAGQIKWKETIVEGIENAPQAFIGLFHGDNFGKMLVKVGPDPVV